MTGFHPEPPFVLAVTVAYEPLAFTVMSWVELPTVTGTRNEGATGAGADCSLEASAADFGAWEAPVAEDEPASAFVEPGRESEPDADADADADAEDDGDAVLDASASGEGSVALVCFVVTTEPEPAAADGTGFCCPHDVMSASAHVETSTVEM
ncbi:hypothetical protein [Streptomyces anulatus]|uniref:hypothetical protein n=1 Tax=Streptomyces anulatus TaxID=1892 RepID=UPI00332A59B7